MKNKEMTGAENVVWDLSEYYQSIEDPKINEDLDKAENLAKEIAKEYRGKIEKPGFFTPEKAKELYQKLEKFQKYLLHPNTFVHLKFSENTSDQDVMKFLMKFQERANSITNHLIFIEIELAKVDHETIEKIYQSELAANYHHTIKMARLFKDHVLSEAAEKMSKLKDITGSSAFRQLYQEFTSDFEYQIEIDGEMKTMNGSQIRNLRHHSNPKIRELSAKVQFGKYQENKLVLGNIYNNIVKDRVLEKKERGFKSSIQSKNMSNELSDETVNTMIKTITKNDSLVQEYYQLKTEMLNIGKLKLSDLYAPVSTKEKEYSWNEAKETVLSGMKKFDQKFYEITKSFFDDNRIHAKIHPKKRDGAFCASSTVEKNPFVLVNFMGRQRDVITLAHELGHGIHSVLSQKQTQINFHPIMPLAEIASIFSEMLLTDKLLKEMTDQQAKISLITSKLEDIFATTNRQNMFTRFELRAHEAIEKEKQSADQLSKIYQEELERVFDDVLEIPAEYHWEWAGIPHIFSSPFYCYSYAFAQLLVIALYQQYLQKGKDFKPGYFELLASGGSASPQTLLKKVNIDLSNPDFWQSGFDYIKTHLLDELKKLL